jgi:hypothetical protein
MCFERARKAHLKFMNTYHIQNWATAVLCTNFAKALILAEEDRRWAVPKVTEQKLSWEAAHDFRLWLRTGGLEAIVHWAQEWPDYVKEGEEAPSSPTKRALAETQAPDYLHEAVALAEGLALLTVPKALSWRQVREYLVKNYGMMMSGDDAKVRRAMAAACQGGRWTAENERIRLLGELRDYALMNGPLVDEITRLLYGEWAGLSPRERGVKRNDFIRERLEHPGLF